MSAYARVKRILLGAPLAGTRSDTERVVKFIALAVFASDAISSTAYASEEVLLALLAGFDLDTAFKLLIPISFGVVILLAFVVFSYSQTIRAYPQGGGSYIVSRENLGTNPSLAAGGSLLLDYTLTVAVSVSAGTAAITSMAPSLTAYRLPIAVGVIIILAVGNLRGMREAGRIFAAPTYIYVLAMAALIGGGFFMYFTGSGAMPANPEARLSLDESITTSAILILVLMRAFSSGAVALTGVEAISNAVPSFKPPAPRNATITLVWMAVILGGLFFALALLINVLKPTPYAPDSAHYQTLLSQLGHAVFGTSFMYYVLQIATALILIFAANTAFQGFPRLAAIMAKDGYMPRRLSGRGDRLVFSNGILVLAALALILVAAFDANTSKLIPLYAVGVFCAFTLSQIGMVAHHRRVQEPHWKRSAVINLAGGVATGIVLLEIIISKFLGGAWISVLLIVLFVIMFKAIRRHYDNLKKALAVHGRLRAQSRSSHTVVVLARTANKLTAMAVEYARDLDPSHLAVVSIVYEQEDQEQMASDWDEHGFDEPIEFVYSPFRELVGPLFDYLDELEERWGDDVVTLVITDYLPSHWWEYLLHSNSSFLLKARLRFRANTIVTSVPFNPAVESALIAEDEPDAGTNENAGDAHTTADDRT